MTARDEVRAAAKTLVAHSSAGTFTVEEILDQLRPQESIYEPSTIRTHVGTLRICANASDHHAVTTLISYACRRGLASSITTRRNSLSLSGPLVAASSE
jgi:hypothetical protein